VIARRLRVSEELKATLWNHGVEVFLGSDSTVPHDLMVEAPCSLKFANFNENVSIGAFSYVVSGFVRNAHIGRYSSVGEDVQIGRGDHLLTTGSTSPVFQLGRNLFQTADEWKPSISLSPDPDDKVPDEKIHVGHDVWIGHGAFIRPGVTIGTGAVVGAMSVVTKDVPPYLIVAGNPAKPIRYRFEARVVERLLNSEWWEYPLDEVRQFFKLLIGEDNHERFDLFRRKTFYPSFHLHELDLVSSQLRSQASGSGAEYFKSDSARFRERADRLFEKGKSGAASVLYRDSFLLREEGQLYTTLNGALATIEAGNIDEAIVYAKTSFEFRDFDENFFLDKFGLVLGKLLGKTEIAGHRELIAQFDMNIQSSRPNVALLVAGFPRSGTSSIAMDETNLQDLCPGLVSESFAFERTLIADDLEQLYEQFEQNLWLGAVLRVVTKPNFIDKTTLFSLSLPLMESFRKRYSSSGIMLTVRDPLGRALSACKMNFDGNGIDPFAALLTERAIIRQLGGPGSIYNDLSALCQYLAVMAESKIQHPVLYPSVLAKKLAANVLRVPSNATIKRLEGQKLNLRLNTSSAESKHIAENLDLRQLLITELARA